MNNLSTINNTDITILESGEAFISQTKLATLCGISKQAIQKGVQNNTYGCQLNLKSFNKINQLDTESALSVVCYYATNNKKNKKAVALFKYMNSINSKTIVDMLNFKYEEQERKDTSGYVYLFECEDYYKIGMSKTDVDDRLKACQTGNPFEISIIYFKKVKNAYRAEKYLHSKYREYQHKNEWFFGLDVCDVINQIDNIQ